jgi:tetraacyldisaccharide 4'-kinase
VSSSSEKPLQPPRKGPLPGWLWPLARACSWGYSRIIARNNRAFDAGKGVLTFDRPVISIGNLSVGGTGKTPMVAWTVDILRSLGHHPCIAMRGYGSHQGNLSDEAQIYASRFGDEVPIVAQPDRAEGLIELFATDRGENITCIVLDDGFQHRRIERNINIVLIDTTRSPWDDALLPAGWLREGPDSLNRAHAVVFTHAHDASRVDELTSRALAINPSLTIGACTHRWDSLTFPLAQPSEPTQHPATWLTGKRIVAACAIGNPHHFLHAISQHKPGQLTPLTFPDHDPLGPAALRRILDATRTADVLVVTQKDWSKLKFVKPDLWNCPIAVTQLELDWSRGAENVSRLIQAELSK